MFWPGYWIKEKLGLVEFRKCCLLPLVMTENGIIRGMSCRLSFQETDERDTL